MSVSKPSLHSVFHCDLPSRQVASLCRVGKHHPKPKCQSLGQVSHWCSAPVNAKLFSMKDLKFSLSHLWLQLQQSYADSVRWGCAPCGSVVQSLREIPVHVFPGISARGSKAPTPIATYNPWAQRGTGASAGLPGEVKDYTKTTLLPTLLKGVKLR